MTPTRASEQEVAIRAVRAAATACRSVQKGYLAKGTLEKKDKSPVTVADFASQAIICASLEVALPDDPIVGEEDADTLRLNEQETIRNAVVQHVRTAIGDDLSDDQVLDWIDRGGSTGAEGRYWTLDPIDGTKGFLRMEQYAIALALIEDNQVILGVLGCPNLMSNDSIGSLFVAERGKGTLLLPLTDEDTSPGKRIRVSQIVSPADARFCESVESGHSNQNTAQKIARRLGITAESLRMDSQCKYATVAQGSAQIYLRVPTSSVYREKIWDHAAGMLVVEEAGGKVTDVIGRPLDFTHGRQLEKNSGIVATNGLIHNSVVDAVRQELAPK